MTPSPDYARGHSDGWHAAMAEREPTEADQATELRAMVAWATLQNNSDRSAHLDTTGADLIS